MLLMLGFQLATRGYEAIIALSCGDREEASIEVLVCCRAKAKMLVSIMGSILRSNLIT